jgi:hypothetical protein
MAPWKLRSVVWVFAVAFPVEAWATQGGQVGCSKQASVWRRATRNDSRDYCDLVDRARARLSSDPQGASALSARAMELRPAAVEARLIYSHALGLLGESQRAHEEFTRAVPHLAAADLTSALTPPVVTMGARAALLSGDYAAALQRYRWVALRLAGLQSESEQARVLIEAATAAMYESPDGFREAHAYLAQAHAKNAPLQRPIVDAARVLVWLREGQRERAAGLARRFESSWGLVWIFDGQARAVGRRDEALPVLPAGESWALAAAVAETVEVKAAEIHWKAFYEEAEAQLPSHLQRSSGK